jgi:hypothetical protein
MVSVSTDQLSHTLLITYIGWDRDHENTKKFPSTVKIIQQLNIPACEVFFARQEALSGIKPHSDQNNFILTCHLGLQVEVSVQFM